MRNNLLSNLITEDFYQIEKWYNFQVVYRYISSLHVHWITNITVLNNANTRQIKFLIKEQKDHPKLQNALNLIYQSDEQYFYMVTEEDLHDRCTDVLIALKKVDNHRKVCICQVQQRSSYNFIGLLLTLFLSLVIATKSPYFAVVLLITKLAADDLFSRKDVSRVAAIKELEKAGIITDDCYTRRMELVDS